MIDLDKARWFAKHCDFEVPFERNLSRTLDALICEVETLREDLAIATGQRAAAFREIEKLQDEARSLAKTENTSVIQREHNPDTAAEPEEAGSRPGCVVAVEQTTAINL